jgi:hypothetical protein
MTGFGTSRIGYTPEASPLPDEHYLNVCRHDDGLDPEVEWDVEHPGCTPILRDDAPDGEVWIEGYECQIDSHLAWYGSDAFYTEQGERFDFAAGRYVIKSESWGRGEDYEFNMWLEEAPDG